jgi:predicted ATPase/class 3 adenylate cyclase
LAVAGAIAMNAPNPSTIVTQLFTDLEGSSKLWEREPDRMGPALARHDALAREAVERNHGMVIKKTGDGVHAAFEDPLDALLAALEIQLGLTNPEATAGLELRVRCGLHVGAAERRENDFFSSSVNRAARIMSTAHGGQVLASQAVFNLVHDRMPPEMSLKDLGIVRLRDLAAPEHVFQLAHPLLRQNFPALRALESPPTNLPQQVTSFIGRERELAEVIELLKTTRILTLQGAGGIGKTRLALQVAARETDAFPDGVWFVDLASVVDPGLVTNAIAHELGVQEEPGAPLLQTLYANLALRRLLLILDNCEHLLDACARVVDALVHTLPGVSILNTSREALRIGGEQTYPLAPLSLPDPKADLATLSRSDAVALFVERARQRQPDFTINTSQVSAVAQICIQLDGIPLALELAAARVGSLSVGQIAERLGDRFHLLRAGSRAAEPRQQTLRAMIDWSYDLLNQPERLLFRRLSVFAGGWELEATEAVGAGGDIAPGHVLDLLTDLVHKSLVVKRDSSQRYGMLETIRQYAHDRLREDGEEQAIHARHLDYYLGVAQQAGSALRIRPGQATWLRRLSAERDNMIAALHWSLEGSGSVERALRLCAALMYYWRAHGRWHEGREWCLKALERAASEAPTQARVEVLLAAATTALRLGARSEAQLHAEQALALARELGDRKLQVDALNSLGNSALDEGDFERARELLEQAVAISRDLGDHAWEAVYCVNAGYLFNRQGNFAAARAPLEKALALSREAGNRWVEASALGNLGMLARHTGDLAEAQGRANQALAIFRELGAPARAVGQLQLLAEVAMLRDEPLLARDHLRKALAMSREAGDPMNTLNCLDLVVGLAVKMGEHRQAANFCGAVDGLRVAVNVPPGASDAKQFSHYCAECRLALGDEVYNSAYSGGRELPTDAAVGEALRWLTRSLKPAAEGQPVASSHAP